MYQWIDFVVSVGNDNQSLFLLMMSLCLKSGSRLSLNLLHCIFKCCPGCGIIRLYCNLKKTSGSLGSELESWCPGKQSFTPFSENIRPPSVSSCLFWKPDTQWRLTWIQLSNSNSLWNRHEIKSARFVYMGTHFPHSNGKSVSMYMKPFVAVPQTGLLTKITIFLSS